MVNIDKDYDLLGVLEVSIFWGMNRIKKLDDFRKIRFLVLGLRRVLILVLFCIYKRFYI